MTKILPTKSDIQPHTKENPISVVVQFINMYITNAHNIKAFYSQHARWRHYKKISFNLFLFKNV